MEINVLLIRILNSRLFYNQYYQFISLLSILLPYPPYVWSRQFCGIANSTNFLHTTIATITEPRTDKIVGVADRYKMNRFSETVAEEFN